MLGGVSEPNLTQKVALYSKPSVVRIFSGCSGTYTTQPELGNEIRPYLIGNIGSGFFISSEGYILTSAHVVDASKGGEIGCTQKLFENLVRDLTGEEDIEKIDSARKDYIKEQSNLKDFEYFQYVYLPNSQQNNADALRFDIKEIGTTELGTGKDIAIIKIQLSNTPVLKIGDSGNVKLGDRVVVIGYPFSGDRFDEFDDNSIVEAGVFEGSISKTNATLKDNTRVLELDTSVGYGSSGSPVLDDQGNVVGMITFNEVQAFNQVLQGSSTPLANRTESLLEYVRQAGIINEPGNLDILYRDGLDFLWDGNFNGARLKFESVKDLFPQHSEIIPLLQEVRSSIAEAEAREINYTPFVVGIGVVGCLLGVAYWLSNRRSLRLTTTLADQGSGTISVGQLTPKPQGHSIYTDPKRQQIKQATVIATDPYIELRNQSGQKYYLYLRNKIHTLGRDPEWSDIKNIPDDGWTVISRKQATLHREGVTYRIFDGDKKRNNPSSNGILVDGQPINDEGYMLRHGDCLSIGGDPRTQVFLAYYNPEID